MGRTKEELLATLGPPPPALDVVAVLEEVPGDTLPESNMVTRVLRLKFDQQSF